MGETWSLEWKKDQQVFCSSIDEVFRELENLERIPLAQRLIVLLVAPTRDNLLIGIGGSLWYLNTVPPEGTPSYTSWNPTSVGQPETVEQCDLFGELTELNSASFIPRQQAKAAIGHFMQTLERDPRVQWEQD